MAILYFAIFLYPKVSSISFFVEKNIKNNYVL